MPDVAPTSEEWWGARRWRYNRGLLIAGAIAFVGYIGIACTILPKEAAVNEFSILSSGVSFFLGANLCYCLGPISERILRPANLEQYRRRCYGLGFWFSMCLPFGILAYFTILSLWFPDFWKDSP